jgi:osmotically-inducible protein OsmY
MAYDDYERDRYSWPYGRYGSERYNRRGSELSDLGYYDEPYYRSYRYDRYYKEPYWNRDYERYYTEPYGSYDYGRYEYDRRHEPYRPPSSYEGRYEGRYPEPYERGRYGRGAEDRGFFERAGDEIKAWFGDEEAERRRRGDEMRARSYAGRGPSGYRRSDERIREDVNERLTEDPYLDATNIEVSVSNSEVTLTGLVDGRHDKRRAGDLAESVSGVMDVNNQLRINQTQPPAQTDATGTARIKTAKS